MNLTVIIYYFKFLKIFEKLKMDDSFENMKIKKSKKLENI